MTLEELSRYYRLHMQLERNLEMLESLEAAARPGAQVITGMPHAAGVRDKIGDLAVEIADLKDRIQPLREAMEREEEKLSRFISSIENDQTRMIFRLRFLRCLTWKEVAAVIGGRNSENSVKSICYRYLESCVDVMRRATAFTFIYAVSVVINRIFMQTLYRSKVIGQIFNRYCSGSNSVLKDSQTTKSKCCCPDVMRGDA